MAKFLQKATTPIMFIFQINAPDGTLATLSAMSGGAHFGFGKGVGGLLGGVLKDQLQSMALAFRFRFIKMIKTQSLFIISNIYVFRAFSIGAFASAAIFGFYFYCIGSKYDIKKNDDNELKQIKPIKH